jgi:4-aminobutyrate aminotransferase-like enzyme
MSKLIHTGINKRQSNANPIVGGSGVYLHFSDGSRLIDASNTGGPLGHAHPAMVEAIAQIASFPVANDSQPWREREQAADELIDVAFEGDNDWIGGVRFGLSGSEVNDIALSLAQAVTGRASLVARERAYHGLVGLSRDVTLQPQWHGGLSLLDGGIRPPHRPQPVRTLVAPDGGAWYAEGVTSPPALDDADLIAAMDDAAAVIIDYTQGGHYYAADYQQRVAAAAREAGSLWIADEVVTGFGRCGDWFAFRGAASRPDIVTLGKPLAGGAAPAGAVVLSKSLLETLGDAKWQNYSTFRSHPTMIHAMRAHLKVVKEDDLAARAATTGARLGRLLMELAGRHPCISRIAGQGLHWTVELHGSDWRQWLGDTAERQIIDHVVAVARDKGVIIGTSGEATSLFIAPPLIIEDAEIDQIIDALDAGLKQTGSRAGN